MTYPNGRVITYSRDAAGRVVGVTGTLGGVTTRYVTDVQYVPFGPATSITMGNGVAVWKPVDGRGQVTEITAGLGTATDLFDSSLLLGSQQ